VFNARTGSDSTLIASVNPKRLQKMDEKTVRIHLDYPDYGILYGIASNNFSIVPVGYDVNKPIGSGPFKFQSITPGKQATFVRNDNYWQSGKPYLDELHVIDFADPETTRVNALTSGQIDGADNLSYSLSRTIEANSSMKLLVSKAYAYQTWEMRMDIAPFNDPRVRQALRLIADRDQIVQQAFNGTRFAQVANDWPAFQDPAYDHSIPQRKQDIEQAKSLLKQAGRSDLTIEMAVTAAQPGIVETAQVLAQQAKAAGVTIKVNNTPSSTYFDKYFKQAPFKFDYFDTESVWEHIGYCLLPGKGYNVSNWKDDPWLKLVTEARGTVDATKRNEKMGEAQKIFFDRGSQAVFNYHRTVDAHSKKFTGFKESVRGHGLNGLHFEDVGLA
jgi:peptide/nickel transport system substrate-binding protein